MEITAKLLNELRKDINEVLKDVGEKYGVEIFAGKTTYDESSFKMTLEAKTTDKELLKKEFMHNATIMGLNAITEDDFENKIDWNGKILTLIGIDTHRPKNCMILKSEDGNRCSCAYDAYRHFATLKKNK